MSLQDDIIKVLLPHFEALQEGSVELSLEASVTQLKTKLATLEAQSGLEDLNLHHQQQKGDDEKGDEELSSPFEVSLGNALLKFLNATTDAEATADLAETVDAFLNLIASLAVSYESNQVTTMVLTRALEFSESLLERVRAHACVFLGKMVAALKSSESKNNKKKCVPQTENTTTRDSLKEILDALFPLLQDKNQAVRCHAIKAIGYFFTTSDDIDTYKVALEVLLWSLAHDPSVSNRIAAIHSLPVHTKTTLDYLIARVRDIKAKVRVEALEVLRSKADVKDMSESQMMELIRSGLTNRCSVTKAAASKMVCAGWMKSVAYDPVVLLKLIGVMDNETEASQVLETIMEEARASDSELLAELSDPEIRAYRTRIDTAAVPLQGLKESQQFEIENLFFLRVRCSNVLESANLSSAQKDVITSKLLPEIPTLCEVFEQHTQQLIAAAQASDEELQDVQSFICLQLLKLAELSNLHEEGSRRHFAFVMKEMLSFVGTPDEIVEGCFNALRKACDSETEMIDSVRDVIGSLQNAQYEKEEVHDENDTTDMETVCLVRILSILTVVLETATSRLSSDAAVQEFAQYIVPSVSHTDSFVREAAVSCFGKLGLFTDEHTITTEFKPILLQVASCDEEKLEIRAQALLALADWSMLFSDCLAPSTVDDTEISFPQVVRRFMDDSRSAAVCISAEVAAKLLFSGRVCDSDWFAKLLTIFFDPRMEEMAKDNDADFKEVGSPIRLQQLLTLFFPAICMQTESTGRDAMMGSIFHMLELVYTKQPSASSKGKNSRKRVTWPTLKMLQYVCSVIDSGKTSEDDSTVAAGEGESNNADEQMDGSTNAEEVDVAAVALNSTSLLAGVQVADFLSKNSHNLTDAEARVLCKFLGTVDFDPEDEDIENLASLKGSLEELGMLLTDTTSLKYIAPLNELVVDVQVEEAEEEESIDSDEEGDENEDDKDEEDYGEEKAEGQIYLNDELLEALEGCKISDGGIEEKENSRLANRPASSNRKLSTENTTSRTSRPRLSDITDNQ